MVSPDQSPESRRWPYPAWQALLADQPLRRGKSHWGNDELNDDETRHIRGANAGKGVRGAAHKRHGGIGEGRRGSEPIRGRDLGGDQRAHLTAPLCRASPMVGTRLPSMRPRSSRGRKRRARHG